LIRRPMRKALKSFTVFHDMELAIDAIKADLPMSGVDEGSQGFKFGRLTARLRSNFSDPLEIAYKNYGFRLGSSQERFKAGYSAEILEDLLLSVNTEYRYDSDDFAVNADVIYVIDDRTSAHLTAGDRMGFGSSPNDYSLIEESGEEGSTGLLFYVEHLF
jgi:hypothetical protein